METAEENTRTHLVRFASQSDGTAWNTRWNAFTDEAQLEECSMNVRRTGSMDAGVSAVMAHAVSLPIARFVVDVTGDAVIPDQGVGILVGIAPQHAPGSTAAR